VSKGGESRHDEAYSSHEDSVKKTQRGEEKQRDNGSSEKTREERRGEDSRKEVNRRSVAHHPAAWGRKRGET